jgi:hypothetical protein
MSSKIVVTTENIEHSRLFPRLSNNICNMSNIPPTQAHKAMKAEGGGWGRWLGP